MHTSTATFLSDYRIEQATTPHIAEDCFYERFGCHRLPRGLRDEARGMGWHLFMATYAPTPGAMTINTMSVEPGAGAFGSTIYSAEIRHNSKTQPSYSTHRHIAAGGPVAACTAIFAEAGRPMEILNFHQVEVFESTVTFIQACTMSGKTRWAMGMAGSPEDSVAHAMSAASQRLYGWR